MPLLVSSVSISNKWFCQNHVVKMTFVRWYEEQLARKSTATVIAKWIELIWGHQQHCGWKNRQGRKWQFSDRELEISSTEEYV